MKGTVRARGTNRWQVQVYAGRDAEGREKRVARTIHGTSSDADDALRDLIREVQAGRHSGDNPTVAELAEQWYQARRADWSPDTVYNYRCSLDNWVLPRLGKLRARKVTARTIDQAYADMAKSGAGAQTIGKAHTVTRSMFTQAAKWGIVTANPAANATPPRIIEEPVDPPDPAAVHALLRAIDEDPRLAAWVRLAATTGCRRGEICALQWGDVDLDRGTMVITRALGRGGVVKTTKTTKGKAMALDTATVAALTRWRAAVVEAALQRKAGTPKWVFPADRDLTQPARRDTMTHRWIRLRDEHGLDGVHLHHLRHFMASQMLAAGVDVRTVANRLGHANPSTTLRVYAHLIPEADRAAADQLGALLDESG